MLWLIERQAEGQEPPHPSDKTLNTIAQFEWFRDKAYLDSAGIPTIGYGFTRVNGKPVQIGDTMSRSVADSMFWKVVSQYTNWRNFVKVPLTENQQAALTSFEYNLGQGIWQKNAMPIINSLNKWDTSGAIAYLNQYVNAGGNRVQWLANRRNAESKLLNS
jgi:lysozyme